MQRTLFYTLAFWMAICLASLVVKAAPVVPQVWTDEQGQIFAVAFEGSSEANDVTNQVLLNTMKTVDVSDFVEDYEEDEDNMYTTSTVLVLPVPSVKERFINYVNTMLTFSSWSICIPNPLYRAYRSITIFPSFNYTQSSSCLLLYFI